ncbi:MAG: hypothetical protein AAGF84_08730 [Planctomycetota bacterium]
MKFHVTVAVCLAAVLLGGNPAVADEPAVVTVELLHRQMLGDASELDRGKFFNVHSSYAAPALTAEDLEQLKELNVGFGRSFDGPFSGHPVGTPYPGTETIRAEGVEKIAAAKAHPLYPYRTTRRLTTTEARNAFSMDADPKEMARFAADVLEFHYEDDTRPDFFAPLSLPFVAADKFEEDAAVVRRRMANVFAEIGKEVDRRGLSTQVIGYTSAWPMMHYWDFKHWADRMQMFMDVAGPHMDGICFLMMDAMEADGRDRFRSGSRVEALLDMVETYGAMKWGQPKPHAISEYGGVAHGWPLGNTYTPARASAELNSYNRFLFTLLGREDRLLFAVPFITTKSPWFYKQPRNPWQPYVADLWRPDPESIRDGAPTRFLETEKMEFYRLWRDVRGHRAVTRSTDPDIVSFAFTDGTDAFLCLQNFEEASRDVRLELPPGIPSAASVNIKRMSVPKQRAVIYTKREAAELPTRLVMAPHEVVVIHLRYDEPLEPTRTVRTTHHYSDDFLQPIVADQPVSITIAADDADVGQVVAATLRIGLAREHDRSKRPALRVNDTDVAFPSDWLGDDQAHRKQGFFGAVEIPLPTGIVRPENTVSITFPDTGGRISTAILRIDGVAAE